MILNRLRDLWNRRKIRHAREADQTERDARSSEMITNLQDRRDVAENFLIPRQRRNHWQEAISTMIHSGGHP